jgi:hypothetical protein
MINMKGILFTVGVTVSAVGGHYVQLTEAVTGESNDFLREIRMFFIYTNIFHNTPF